MNCEDCNKDIEDVCRHCKSEDIIEKSEWIKYTVDGTLPFFC